MLYPFVAITLEDTEIFNRLGMYPSGTRKRAHLSDQRDACIMLDLANAKRDRESRVLAALDTRYWVLLDAADADVQAREIQLDMFAKHAEHVELCKHGLPIPEDRTTECEDCLEDLAEAMTAEAIEAGSW